MDHWCKFDEHLNRLNQLNNSFLIADGGLFKDASAVCARWRNASRKTKWSMLILCLTGEITTLIVTEESRWCRDYSHVLFSLLQMSVKSSDLIWHTNTADIQSTDGFCMSAPFCDNISGILWDLGGFIHVKILKVLLLYWKHKSNQRY